MPIKHAKWIGAVVIVMLLSMIAPATSAQSNITGDAVKGGLLYDNWFYTLDIPAPEEDNPLWQFQELNDFSGESTWRCSECHGWDYKGVDGVYSTGIHRTDFPGIIHTVDMPVEDIRDALSGINNPDHNFEQYIGKIALEDLVAFLKTKPVNLNRFIDRETGKIYGEEQNGFFLYRANCASCHGYDGAFMLISIDGKDNYLSDLAFEDPWRMFHKIRFGHPDSEMPAMEEENWSLQNVADVLVYLRTLPQLREEHELEGIEIVRLDYSQQADLNLQIYFSGAIFLLVLIGAVITIRKSKPSS